MKKILFTILCLFIFTGIFSQQYSKWFTVPDKVTAFGRILPANAVTFEIDSLKFYQLTALVTATQTMADVFTSGNYNEIPIGSTYWHRVDGSLFPTTITDSVGIGTAALDYQLEVLGDYQNKFGDFYLENSTKAAGSNTFSGAYALDGARFIYSGVTIDGVTDTMAAIGYRRSTSGSGIFLCKRDTNEIRFKYNSITHQMIRQLKAYTYIKSNRVHVDNMMLYIDSTKIVIGRSSADAITDEFFKVDYDGLTTIPNTPEVASPDSTCTQTPAGELGMTANISIEDMTGNIANSTTSLDTIFTTNILVEAETPTTNTITNDYTFTNIIPKGFLLEGILFEETNGNTATLDLGTAAGGSQVFINQTITASEWTFISINKFFSDSGTTTLYLNDDDAGSSWNGASVNVTYVMKQIF